MSLEELIEKAEVLTDEEFDEEVWLGFIENVLKKMNPFTKIFGSQIIPLEDKSIIEIPNEVFELLDVSYRLLSGRMSTLRRLQPGDRFTKGWLVEGDSLILRNIDQTDIELLYYEKLRIEEQELEENEPQTVYITNLPEKYHHILLSGICAEAMQAEEEPEKKEDFYKEFENNMQVSFALTTESLESWRKK